MHNAHHMTSLVYWKVIPTHTYFDNALDPYIILSVEVYGMCMTSLLHCIYFLCNKRKFHTIYSVHANNNMGNCIHARKEINMEIKYYSCTCMDGTVTSIHAKTSQTIYIMYAHCNML